MRRVIPAVCAVVALLALSGCFKMDMEMEVHSDDTVSGTLVMAMDKETVAMFEGMGDSGSSEAMNFFEDTDVPEGAKVSDYEDDKYVGQQMTFEGLTLDELAKTADAEDENEWTLTHTGDTYEFSGAMDLTEDESDMGMGEALKDAELRVAITFPGKVTDTNGEVDGNTVVWHPEYGEKNPMQAVAVEGGFPTAIVGSLVFVGLLAAAGGFLFLRHRKAAPAPAPGAVDPAYDQDGWTTFADLDDEQPQASAEDPSEEQ